MDFFDKRRQKRRERIQRLYERQKRLRALLREHGSDILNSENFKGTRRHIQHGNMTVYSHVMNVARYSLLLNKKFRLGCNKHDLIRGALLHDYFLYDWHEKDPTHRLHGLFHAGTALKNAKKDFRLNKIEENIIARHMFPINPIFPRYKEAWIVCLADKYCAAEETIGSLFSGRRTKRRHRTGQKM